MVNKFRTGLACEPIAIRLYIGVEGEVRRAHGTMAPLCFVNGQLPAAERDGLYTAHRSAACFIDVTYP